MINKKENSVHSLSDVSMTRLQLLDEIHEFCESNKISYSITGDLLIGIIKKYDLSDYFNSISIVMTPKNYKKFIDASSGLNKNNRSIENIYSNIYYPDISTRYIATDTLSISLLGSNYINNGIYISIQPLINYKLYRSRNKDDFFELLFRKIKSLKRFDLSYINYIAHFAALVHYHIQRKKINKIFNFEFDDFYIPINELKIKLSNKIIFSEKKYNFFDKNFQSYQFDDLFLSKLEYLTSQYQPSLVLNSNYIESASISFDQWKEKTKDIKDSSIFYDLLKQKICAAGIKLIENFSDYSHNKYLIRFAYEFHTFKYSKIFLHEENIIKELLDKKEFEKIENKISSYLDALEFFLKRNLLLYINDTLIMAAINLYRNHDLHFQADTIELMWMDLIGLKNYLALKNTTKDKFSVLSELIECMPESKKIKTLRRILNEFNTYHST